MLLQSAEPLITWPDPLVELFGFVALFLASGAVGFRFSALRQRLGIRRAASATDDVHETSGRRAAVYGLVGALAGLYPLWRRVAGGAARAHAAVGPFVLSNAPTALGVILAILAIVGFLLAMRGRRAGWLLAVIGVVLGALPPLFTAQWSRLVNPVHALAAGLWIGSLFVMVVAGIIPVLREPRVRDQRGPIVANMVHGFSPLALSMGMVVVIFGLITAWNHLNPLSSLWSTPYGYALWAKLVFVALVFGLGGWNWRRQRPTLGSDAAAFSIRRPSPKRPAPAGSPARTVPAGPSAGGPPPGP
jgi:putative copper export protein